MLFNSFDIAGIYLHQCSRRYFAFFDSGSGSGRGSAATEFFVLPIDLYETLKDFADGIFEKYKIWTQRQYAAFDWNC